MKLKVCGMTEPSQVEALGEMKIDYAGFIFYPKSKRYALQKLCNATIREMKQVKKVGVFVNADAREIQRTVEEADLQMVQLHGDESAGFCEKIAAFISVIKAFRIGEGENVEYKVRDYQDPCDMFLFDTKPFSGGKEITYGGTGKKFNWELLNAAPLQNPYFLSGGIGPGDIADLEAFMQKPAAQALHALDINSQFEISPGDKNLKSIHHFFEEVKKW